MSMYVMNRTHGITHIVNCTFGESKIPNFHAGKLNYYNFAVGAACMLISNAVSLCWF